MNNESINFKYYIIFIFSIMLIYLLYDYVRRWRKENQKVLSRKEELINVIKLIDKDSILEIFLYNLKTKTLLLLKNGKF